MALRGIFLLFAILRTAYGQSASGMLLPGTLELICYRCFLEHVNDLLLKEPELNRINVYANSQGQASSILVLLVWLFSKQ